MNSRPGLWESLEAAKAARVQRRLVVLRIVLVGLMVGLIVLVLNAGLAR